MGASLASANLEGANLASANLMGANLADACLASANLARANLEGANGAKLTLIGRRPLFHIGPLGSRCATLYAFLTDAGVYVRTGCFWGTLDAFKAAVVKTHGTSDHATEYQNAITMIEWHAHIWSKP